ncbi:MAG: ABC transporter substrate-binding protein [SAR324 cluster bacterium]|nr:ABC transporter substrate-binding protein [SAR324 cluster bacterium]
MRYGIAVLLIVLSSFISQAYAACGKVTVADMNWSSAELIANIDVFILEHGFGCDAELVPGDTMPTGTSMIEKGEPDIAPELWSNSFTEALQKGVEEKRLRIAGRSLSDGGEEGFWVPKYLVDKDPSIATIEGVIKNKKLFKHPENPDKYAFMGCPAGWGCQISSSHLFEALELKKHGFEMIDPGSGAGLAGAIAKAYERKEAWFGYYWAPTDILGKYTMVKVDFGSGVKKDHFLNCLAKANCEKPQVSMYPSSPVHTVTTEQFASKAPEAYEYLSKRAFKNAQMNQLLAWMKDNQADGNIAMEHFLKNYESTWTPWVSSAVAQKVKKALKQM